jgi:hypothetical protein
MVIPVPGPAYRTAPGLFCLRLTIYAYFPRFILGGFAEQKRFALGKTGKGFMNHLVWNATVRQKRWKSVWAGFCGHKGRIIFDDADTQHEFIVPLH